MLAATGARRLVSRELVQSLWSGYGQIVRCTLAGGTMSSIIVKDVQWSIPNQHPRGWATDRSHQRKLRSYEVETTWYEKFAERCPSGCRVPVCLDAERLPGGVSLVLEDLDAAGFGARRASATDSELTSCLSWLAAFHATFMGTAPDGLWESGTYWHLATRPDELAALEYTQLRAAAPEIDRRLSGSAFQTLVHGDAKLANFCFSDDGTRVAAVDFQYVGGGCGMKDVAYFLSSCLDERESARLAPVLLDQYFDLLGQALASVRPEIDVVALEHDWRSLYPFAWADFTRFLHGWSPGHSKLHGYSERLTREVLAELTREG